MKYEACQSCAQYRADGNWDEAISCCSCEGKGALRRPESFICNSCGDTLNRDGFPGGLIDATVSGGFNSWHLFDLTSYTFSICEECLRALFTSFAIPPAIHESMTTRGIDDLEPTYEEDLDYYKYRLWRHVGGHKQKLLTGACNHREYCTAHAEWRLLVDGELSGNAMCDEHRPHYENNINGRLVPALSVPLEAKSDEDLRRVVAAWDKAPPHPMKIAIEQAIQERKIRANV